MFKEKCILIEKNTDRLNHLGDLSPISKGIQETIANQEKTTHVIDVLVLYSENAVDYCDNINEDIEDNAQDAIDQLQLALDYSVPDDDITIDIAGVEEFSFYENWDSIQWDWDTLKADALSRRNATDADLVVLMTDACPSTHQGWYVNGSFWVAGYAPYYGPDAVNAYAIVDVSFATDNKTFAHEVGHLFGCDHESGTGYNHGYKFTVLPPKASGKASTNYRTLMHTPYTGYTRIDRFSNPDVSYSGEDIGVENSYDNARKIENTAGSLKNYRPFAKGTQSPSSQEGGNPRNNVFNSKVEIYPNPLSESTTIRYSLNEPSYVQIKLLDLTGRVCKTIEDGHQSKGFYNLSVGDVRLKSGVYICSIIIGDNQMKKKLFIK